MPSIKKINNKKQVREMRSRLPKVARKNFINNRNPSIIEDKYAFPFKTTDYKLDYPLNVKKDKGLDELYESLRVGNTDTGINLSTKGVMLDKDLIFRSGINIEFEGSGGEIRNANLKNCSIEDLDIGSSLDLNDLSDVTYSDGDLTIAGLDKILTTGDLDFIVAGGDIKFRAHEYGSSYDGGVEFNITGNTVKFQRNIDTGLSGFTFNLGMTSLSIETSTGDDFKMSSGGNTRYTTSSDYKKIDFERCTSNFPDLPMASSAEWSSLGNFRDALNVTSGADGTKVYAMMRGWLAIEDDTGFDETFLIRMETDIWQSVSFTNYGGTVAGTVKGTATNHGYLTGDTLLIEDTTDYDGQEIITKIDNNFKLWIILNFKKYFELKVKAFS